MVLNSLNMVIIAKEFFNNLHLIVKFIDESHGNEADLIKSYIDTNSLIACNLLDFPNNSSKAQSCIDIYCNSLNKDQNINSDKLAEILLNSYVTIVEVIKIDTGKNNNYTITIKDCISNKEYTFTDNNFFDDDIEENDFLLCRLADFDTNLRIVEIIDVFDIIKYQLLLNNKSYTSELLAKIYNGKFFNSKLLKNYTIDLFLIYSQVCREYEDYIHSDNEDYDINVLSECIVNKNHKNLFIEFINKKNPSFISVNMKVYIEKCLALFNFYNMYLYSKDYTLSDFNKIDIKKAFLFMSENGYFKNMSQFIYTANVLSEFYIFMKEKNDDFKDSDIIINSIKNIKNNIFLYKDLLMKSCNGYFYDDYLVDIFNKSNTVNMEFRDDFDSLFGFIELNENPIGSNGELLNSAIKVISDSFELEPEKEVSILKQNHFSLIDYYFYFMKHKNMIEATCDYSETEEILNSHVSSTIMTLDDAEFFSLLIHSFVKTDLFSKYRNINKINYIKDSFKVILTELNNRKNVNLNEFKLKKNYDFTLEILRRFGLITNTDNLYNITNLGKNIYNYYININTNKVISLF